MPLKNGVFSAFLGLFRAFWEIIKRTIDVGAWVREGSTSLDLVRVRVRVSPSRRNFDPHDQGVPNAPEVQPPQGEVTNVEFLYAIWILSQVVANQAGQQRVVRQDVAETSKISKDVVWLRNFLKDLGVVPSIEAPITLYCDNSGAVANSKEPQSYKKSKHIERKYHLIRDITQRGDVRVLKIESKNNLADPFTKGLPQKSFDNHMDEMGVQIVHA
ncbi:hypothetical protein MTR67_052488 [Solanum verrucosum]|uniref:Uncharacterized protein n=1 Tax=Solanum verrucosum TaxID=315347 RepID=A0AAF1A2X4_SOLVR|nr:hypothetical protein MTR67_052488 [Solanum verrucosum]